ncbi:rplA [Scenedesmus sp. PABB004]|nr:rplA [Scenedesmus sp. PABB004]
MAIRVLRPGLAELRRASCSAWTAAFCSQAGGAPLQQASDGQPAQQQPAQQQGLAAQFLFDPQQATALPRFIAQAPQQPLPLMEALQRVQSGARARFPETVEAHVRLKIDPRRGDQMVRGAAVLPHSLGKPLTVAVFAEGADADAARAAGELRAAPRRAVPSPSRARAARGPAPARAPTRRRPAGADVVGGDELIASVAEARGKALPFNACVATPDMMPRLVKLGRILGPRGLMPNPKVRPRPALGGGRARVARRPRARAAAATRAPARPRRQMGTLTDDVVAAVAALRAGRVEFKADRGGVVHAPIGRVGDPLAALYANMGALAAALLAAKPEAIRGGLPRYVRGVSLASTQGRGVAVEVSSLAAAIDAAATAARSAGRGGPAGARQRSNNAGRRPGAGGSAAMTATAGAQAMEDQDAGSGSSGAAEAGSGGGAAERATAETLAGLARVALALPAASDSDSGGDGDGGEPGEAYCFQPSPPPEPAPKPGVKRSHSAAGLLEPGRGSTPAAVMNRLVECGVLPSWSHATHAWVRCGPTAQGVFSIATGTILCLCGECATRACGPRGKPVTWAPAAFERHGGMAASKKWRGSILVKGLRQRLNLGQWLDARGVLAGRRPSLAEGGSGADAHPALAAPPSPSLLALGAQGPAACAHAPLHPPHAEQLQRQGSALFVQGAEACGQGGPHTSAGLAALLAQPGGGGQPALSPSSLQAQLLAAQQRRKQIETELRDQQRALPAPAWGLTDLLARSTSIAGADPSAATSLMLEALQQQLAGQPRRCQEAAAGAATAVTAASDALMRGGSAGTGGAPLRQTAGSSAAAAFAAIAAAAAAAAAASAASVDADGAQPCAPRQPPPPPPPYQALPPPRGAFGVQASPRAGLPGVSRAVPQEQHRQPAAAAAAEAPRDAADALAGVLARLAGSSPSLAAATAPGAGETDAHVAVLLALLQAVGGAGAADGLARL